MVRSYLWYGDQGTLVIILPLLYMPVSEGVSCCMCTYVSTLASAAINMCVLELVLVTTH